MDSHRIAIGALLIALLTTPAALAQPFGIDTRAANTSLVIDDLPDDTPGSMQLTRVYDQLAFTNPMLMLEAPDGSGRLFVCERAGVVRVFPKAGDPAPGNVSTFLDISTTVRTSGEHGLLGMAFDPDYADNGRFYLHYSRNDAGGAGRIARFTNDNPADNDAEEASEEIVLQVAQPASNHNGGMIAFGPDGMLYIAYGDGGGSNDQFGNGQNTTTLLGSMLRIDVASAPDVGLNYHIPTDNPFYGGGPDGPSTRKEIWAYGLRNPFRFSFDRVTGRLYLGDVGQNRKEEISVIEKGGNYGWNRMEGFDCFNPSDPNNPPASCDQTGLTLPIADYGRSLGTTVTGGYVYYGSAVPELYGMYLYCDYNSGRVWGLRYDGVTVDGPFALVGANSRAFAGLGQTDEGEVYFLDLFNGQIYALEPITPPAGDSFPTRLSDIPALLAAGLGQDQTDDGIIPYAPSARLWSDGALKQRFIAIPGAGQVGYQASDGWDFPDKTVLIKNFLMPQDERDPQNTLKRVETRLLYFNGGDWHGFSYEWDDAETDAVLLTERKLKPMSIIDADGQPVDFDYAYPSRGDCLQCHTPAAGGVLGLNTPQMNTDFDYPDSAVTDNQLRTFDHIGLFTVALPDTPANLPAMPDPFDVSATLLDRAKAYLAANCSMCHRPGGGAPSTIDLRWEQDVDDMLIVDALPQNGEAGVPNGRIVVPGDPGRSILLHRVDLRDNGGDQMPPLASARVDQEAVDLLTAWLLSDQAPVELGSFTVE
jgi:uncharacterized repeat protein (TIGR03806 family)